MGAYSLVARRCGAAFAEEMMLTGRTYSAQEMKDAGLIHMVVEPGQGIAAAREYLERNKHQQNKTQTENETDRQKMPLSLDELDRIVRVWADACRQLSDRDLKIMRRLVSAQDKLPKAPIAAE